MKTGIVYPQIELQGDPEAVRRFGRAAEDLGYDHINAYDHVLGAVHADRTPPLTGPYTERDPFHDPLIMFAYLAGLTDRIEFASSVLVLPQRQTALVARQAADLDLMSGGRFRLGVGTGWNYAEYDALGQDYAERGRRLDEQVPLLRRLWTEPVVSFEGAFHRLDRVALNPRPRRSIPIWMGGRTEVAFRRAGQEGDGFMFIGDLDRANEGWERIRHHLQQAGRDPASFGRDITTPPLDAARVRDMVMRWRDAGGTHATIGTIGRGLTTVDAHIDFIAHMKRLLDG